MQNKIIDILHYYIRMEAAIGQPKKKYTNHKHPNPIYIIIYKIYYTLFQFK